jgi:hypothetical protein
VTDPIDLYSVFMLGDRTDLLNDPLNINTNVPMTDGRVETNNYPAVIFAYAEGGRKQFFMFEIIIDVCVYDQLSLVTPGRILYEYHINVTDEVEWFPLGEWNFTSNDSYCPPLDENYSIQESDSWAEYQSGSSDEHSVELYQIMYPDNNMTLGPHLWLFPAVIGQYHFYILARSISDAYVFKEVDFTQSYDCDVIPQKIWLDNDETESFTLDKNTGSEVQILTPEDLRGFFKLDNKHRCVI